MSPAALGYVKPMYIETLAATGLRHVSTDVRSFSRFELVSAAPEVNAAMRNALLLPMAIFDAAALDAVLVDWGCSDVEVLVAEGLVEGARWRGAPGLAAVLAPGGGGQAKVRASFRLDPVQFGYLRAAALRDPRLVDALAGGSTLQLHVGLRFSPGFDTLGVDALGIAIGEVGFPASGPDRPAWLAAFLGRLCGRVLGRPLPPAAWHDAASSWSAQRQEHLAQALNALRGPPAAVGRVLPLADEPGVLEAGSIVPVRMLRPSSRAAVGWVGAALVARPDVLVGHGAPSTPPWRRWWATQTEGDDSPLEQVILLHDSHDPRPRP